MSSHEPSTDLDALHGQTVSRWLAFRVRLDRGVAAVLLLVVGPLLLAAGAAVRLSKDKGRVFLRLDRVGKDGNVLRMWKLRTMRVAEADGSGGGAALTAGDTDSRVTSIGRRLRRWRIDELPQLLNVVGGEMALVGPRPEAPNYVDQDDPAWRHVLATPPGLAGPTQVLTHDWENDTLAQVDDVDRHYREEILPVKLAVDRWYVANASPWIDFIVAVSLVQRFAGRSRSTILHRRVGALVPAARAVPRVHSSASDQPARAR